MKKSDDKIRLCHVICDLTSGGVETVILNYLSVMDLSEYELHLITYAVSVEKCAEHFRALGFTIHRVPPKCQGFLNSVRLMYQEIKAERFDIVHAHLTEWNCIPMFLAWLCGVRVRISHSHMAITPATPGQKLLLGCQQFLGKRFATHYMACGDEAGRYLFGKQAFDANRVKVLRNAIRLDAFTYNPSERWRVRAELGIGNSFCVGHVGRFLEQKNHAFLIDIFSEIHKRRPNSRLILVGVGALEGQTREMARMLGLEDDVLFLGSREDVPRLYQAMDVFVLPSLFEGLPLVGVEAQATGLPCFFSDRIAHEAIMSGVVRVLPLDAGAEEWARAILSSPLERIDTQEGIRRAGFSITDNADQLERVYLG